MSNNKTILTQNAPAPIGPYSQAIDTGSYVFISGQIPLDPATGNMCGDTIELQVKQALANLKAVLAAANLDITALVKTTVFLTQMSNFPVFNSIYEKELDGHRPARSVVEVSALPKNSLVEIEAIACR